MEPCVEVPVVDFVFDDEFDDCGELVVSEASDELLLLSAFVLELEELPVDESVDDCEDCASGELLSDGVVAASDDEVDDSDDELALFCFAVLLDVVESLLLAVDESSELEAVSEPVEADAIGA